MGGWVVFGEPRLGFQPLADVVVRDQAKPGYRNGKVGTFEHDYVTDVPCRIGLLQYVHTKALIDLSAPPPPDHEWGIFSYRHIPPYAQGDGGRRDPPPHIVMGR